jgi:excinuclease ABC subunit C
MSARDEAHRFANSYRRRIRADATTATALDAIPGVGPAIRARLLARFGSAKRVGSASVEDIAGVEGVGQVLARRIWKALNAGGG